MRLTNSEELYDHQAHPDEWVNLAGNTIYAALNSSVVAVLGFRN